MKEGWKGVKDERVESRLRVEENEDWRRRKD